MYIGSWKIDDLVTFTCNTHTPSTGAATDADGAPAYRVFEDETTAPILTGTMALLDGSNTAGYYSEQITLSAANGFEKGKSYNIYISAAVGGITGTMSHTLQLEAEVDANVVSDAAGIRAAVGLATANLDTQLTTIDDFLDTEVAAILAAVITEVADIKAKTDALPGDPADASDIAASFTSLASTLTTIAAYIDTEVTSILAAVDTEVGAIKAKTDNLPAAPAAVGDIPTALQNADALLNRDMSAVSDTNARSPLNALRFLRNKWSIALGVLTTTKENDTTAAWTATLTTDAAADPVTGSDPT